MHEKSLHTHLSFDHTQLDFIEYEASLSTESNNKQSTNDNDELYNLSPTATSEFEYFKQHNLLPFTRYIYSATRCTFLQSYLCTFVERFCWRILRFYSVQEVDQIKI